VSMCACAPMSVSVAVAAAVRDHAGSRRIVDTQAGCVCTSARVCV